MSPSSLDSGLVMRPWRISGLARRPRPEGLDERMLWLSVLSVPGHRANLLQGYLETIHVNRGPRSTASLSSGDRHHRPLLTFRKGERTLGSRLFGDEAPLEATPAAVRRVLGLGVLSAFVLLQLNGEDYAISQTRAADWDYPERRRTRPRRWIP